MKYNKYWEFEGKITTLYNQKKYREALNLLEHASEYLPYEFYVNKGIGHAIPQDLPDKLNKALSFIHNRQCVL